MRAAVRWPLTLRAREARADRGPVRRGLEDAVTSSNLTAGPSAAEAGEAASGPRVAIVARATRTEETRRGEVTVPSEHDVLPCVRRT